LELIFILVDIANGYTNFVVLQTVKMLLLKFYLKYLDSKLRTDRY